MHCDGELTFARKIKNAAGLAGSMLLLSLHCSGWQKDSLPTDASHVRWILSLDARSTVIERKHISINGVLTGTGFGKKGHKLTIGYYWLNYGSKQRLINLHKKLAHSINVSYYTKTDVRFVSLAYWYPLYRDKRWVVSLPAEIGLGQESARYREVSGDGYLGKKDFYFGPCQLGIYGEYRVTPWVGLGLQIGYRDAIYRGPFRKHFKGPYYSYGLTFYPDRIYKDLKNHFNRKHQAP